jgi:hypothetical protein
MATATVTPSDAGLVFRPSDYGDLPSLRKAFSAAYAERLRHPERELIVVDNGTQDQRAVIDSVKAGRASDARRGERSFIAEVNTRGKPCSLKRHFGPGCMRQIIGYAEKLASQDPERFIWVRDWQKTAKRGRNGDRGVYGPSQIKRSLWGLEACEFLVPARRFRNGQRRNGWIVARHDDVAAITGRKCRLTASPQFTISPRPHGQRLEQYLDGQGTVKGTVESIPRDCLRDCLRDSEIDSKGLSNGGKRLDGNEMTGRVAKTVSPNPVIPVNPVKREPSYPSDWDAMEDDEGGVKPGPTATTFSLTSMTGGTEEETERQDSDSTPSKTKSSSPIQTVPPSIFGTFPVRPEFEGSTPSSPIQPVQDLKTIAPAARPEFKTWQDPALAENATKREQLHDCVKKISGGAFDPKYLDRYQHPQELLRCCAMALSESIRSPWRDPAHGMARAMELMRELYDLKVPKGWVLVMADLRSKNQANQNRAARCKGEEEPW